MHTALVLDIDGVVCPASGFSPFGALVAVGAVLQPVRVAPALCAALADLGARPGVTPLWLTSWLPQARRAMRGPFPGQDWDQVEVRPSGDAWPKLPALLAWLGRNPHVTRVAWVDDDLGGTAPPDRARHCAEELSRRGVDPLLIAPAAAHGLGPQHIARLRRWIRPAGPGVARRGATGRPGTG
ncbi:HAD domain-containing protein [Dactylosporangium salmoneum]|uniref:HAD domain-containing protein n=1 Tax=Dactylosporangium salmoneum TaxID=53361 RepID=UPI0031D082F2